MKRQKTADSIENEDIVLWKCPILYKVRGIWRKLRNGKYFGTDGFRGEANVDLTVEHAYKVGRFLGWYYGKQARETLQSCDRKRHETLQLYV